MERLLIKYSCFNKLILLNCILLVLHYAHSENSDYPLNWRLDKSICIGNLPKQPLDKPYYNNALGYARLCICEKSVFLNFY
jgi:hypothetical protein